MTIGELLQTLKRVEEVTYALNFSPLDETERLELEKELERLKSIRLSSMVFRTDG